MPKSQRAPVPGVSPNVTVLSIGRPGTYFKARNQLLREAGFKVLPATTSIQARRHAAKNNPCTVVIGHGVPVADRINIVTRLRELNGLIKVIMLYDDTIADTEQADAILNVNGDPHDLIQTILYLKSKHDGNNHRN